MSVGVLAMLGLVAWSTSARIHSLKLVNDSRPHFVISSFGLLKGGSIYVLTADLHIGHPPKAMGFSVHKSTEDSIDYNLENMYQETGVSCVFDAFDDAEDLFQMSDSIIVPIDLETGELYSDFVVPSSFVGVGAYVANGTVLRLFVTDDVGDDTYTIVFHSCDDGILLPDISYSMEIMEVNPGPEFLGAGEDALPDMYRVLSVMFFIATLMWINVLYQNRNSSKLYKVHYVMLALVAVKTLSLTFHAIDYHFISTTGEPDEGWAITSRGMLLFLAILLIGAGFGVVKQVLSDREKKLIAFVLCLQVLANSAYIFMEETGEGVSGRAFWSNIALLVDLLSCGAILYPVIWSIRHLSQTLGTDGKAAASLAKLKLFRRFYVLVLAYIYLTRIIVYLVKNTVHFRYAWVAPCLDELITLAFYVTTAVMFSPEQENPYMRVAADDDDQEYVPMEDIITFGFQVIDIVTENGDVSEKEGLHSTQAGIQKAAAQNNLREKPKVTSEYQTELVDESEL